MSFTQREPLQPKLTALPASKDVDALVRAEHPDPFSILGPHDDEQGGQFIRAFLPEALSVQVLARDTGEPFGSLDATQVPGLFIGHFSTRQPYPDARRVIDAGATVALATNCNPGSSYTTSMSFCIALAVRDMRMTPEEALSAATVGGASALRRGDVGRIAPGCRADLVVLEAPSYTHFVYRPGVPLIRSVIEAGSLT